MVQFLHYFTPTGGEVNNNVTLVLKDFPVYKPRESRRPGELEDRQYQVNVALTGTLDRDGFVADNGPFISWIQTESGINRASPEKLAESVIAAAQETVEGRLVRVKVEVRTVHDGSRHNSSWAKEGERVSRLADSSFSWKRLVVPARLVDNHVCGGYDGQFEADFHVGVKTKKALSGLQGAYERRLLKLFKQGILKSSCEELSLGLVRTALEMVGKNNVVYATGRVYNLTGYAETGWLAGDGMPPFPRPATKREIRQTEFVRRHSRC